MNVNYKNLIKNITDKDIKNISFLVIFLAMIIQFSSAKAAEIIENTSIASIDKTPKKPKARADSTVSLRVLTWNIQMLPRWAVDKDQKMRTKYIIDDLLKQDVDVIVFEEVFDVGIRSMLRLALFPKFPFQVGVQNKKWSWRQSNGVWIISRLPIRELKHIFYRDSHGSDGLANKGAVLVEGAKKGKKFQIIATHLQSMQDSTAQQVRDSQYAQIKRELLTPFAKENVPQMVIGDLNTPKHLSLDYQRMLNTLGMQDEPLADERPYTWDKTNSWNVNYEEHPNSQLDYILINAQKTLAKLNRMLLYRPFIVKKGKKIDLADHYGVLGEVEL